ncbi:toll-like receptor 7 [Lepus europaeus]|uniref:toll-like receptor 7 n=1 Tax=Lepus europaeus TaxID=9983 RepID=UPI002B49E867|nr:toll-like receptor 7 [Lepus europaeus]
MRPPRALWLLLLDAVLASGLLGARWFPKTLPCDVVRAGTEVLVDCTDRRLVAVPEGVPANATNLTLTINHIPHVSPASFRGLSHLVEIDLRCNCVPVRLGPKDHVCTRGLQIERGAFGDLAWLRSLYLDGNQLAEIPRGLPPGLRLLSLEANAIFSVGPGNLTELAGLESLYLGQNCYFRNPCNTSFWVARGAFLQLGRLRVLSLKDDNLTAVPAGLPPALAELYLYNNAITQVREDDLGGLHSLQVLDLSGNCPRCYDTPYPCTPCPGGAALQVHTRAFDALTELHVLRLHSNSLQHVPARWFQNLRRLRELDLSQNFLAGEIADARFLRLLPGLARLDLSFNYDLRVYRPSLNLSDAFSSLNNLEVLRIRGYVFKELSKADLAPLQGLSHLEVLDLGTNFIKMADLGVFGGFERLRLIDLSANKISPVGSVGVGVGVCSDPGAPAVHTSGPRVPQETSHYFKYDGSARSCRFKTGEALSFLPLDGDCRSYGPTLDLSRNSLFFLKASDFRHLSFVRCLNLSGNSLSQTLDGSEFESLSELRYLDLSNNRLDLLHDSAFAGLHRLEVLDLSANAHYFRAEGVTHMLNFTRSLVALQKLLMNDNDISSCTNRAMESTSLRTLEFRGNRLDVLWRDGDTRYLRLFRGLERLEELDISRNALSFLPPGVFDGLPPALTTLHLAGNGLRSFNWGRLHLLGKLEVLDLSHNRLTTVPARLADCSRSLRRLVLSHNRIAQLSERFLQGAVHLRYLDLSSNRIQAVQRTSFPEDVLEGLEVLQLHHNRFLCTCDAVWFAWWLNRTEVTVPELATGVTCAGPGAHSGQSVVSLDLYTCDFDRTSLVLFSLSVSAVLFVMAAATGGHLYMWDAWYLYRLCLARVRGLRRLASGSTCYDAFVAYDTGDPAVAEWVLAELVARLEEPRQGRLNLCLEERDWVPGQPVLENLAQSVQLSRKTLFVLTERYARAQGFRLALYLTHQRLLDEQVDAIVLVFLERPAREARFLRLRRRLCAGSVLEWPANPRAQAHFWQTLRDALAADNHVSDSRVFREAV